MKTKFKMISSLSSNLTPGHKDKSVEVQFPVDSRMNIYGFIFMKNRWLDVRCWKKGMPLKIERNPDST